MAQNDLCYNTYTLRTVLRHHLDNSNLRGDEKASIFGGRGKMSEVLNGKIALSKNTIRALHQMFKIDLHLLLFGEFKVERAEATLTINNIQFKATDFKFNL